MTGEYRAAPWSRRAWVQFAIGLAAAFVLFVAFAFTVRTTVADVYFVPTNVVTPEIPRGARVVVYKLDSALLPGQIVAYRATTGQTWLGRVEAVDDAAGTVVLSTNAMSVTIKRPDVVGRVVLTTR